MFDLKNYRLSLVFCPTDMRQGYNSLSLLAQHFVGVDIGQCKDCVVFVSKSYTTAKMLWADANGGFLVTRKLKNGRFQKLLGQIDAGQLMEVSSKTLLKYLDGEPIVSKRTKNSQGI